ncbi:hypothetical protein MRX96_009303 [Rhipicephalus microplus]
MAPPIISRQPFRAQPRHLPRVEIPLSRSADDGEALASTSQAARKKHGPPADRTERKNGGTREKNAMQEGVTTERSVIHSGSRSSPNDTFQNRELSPLRRLSSDRDAGGTQVCRLSSHFFPRSLLLARRNDAALSARYTSSGSTDSANSSRAYVN